MAKSVKKEIRIRFKIYFFKIITLYPKKDFYRQKHAPKKSVPFNFINYKKLN